MEVSDGPASTVKPTAAVVPLGVTTATFRAPSAAVVAIEKVALMVVALATVNEVTVTPVPLTVTAVAPVRLVPVKTTGMLLVVVANVAEAGAIRVSVGATTVKFTVLVIPSGVVTVSVLTPAAAVSATEQLAFMLVIVGIPEMAQVTPVPDTVTAEALARSVPVRATGTVVPTRPVAGVTEVRDGPASTAKGTTPVVPLGVTTATFTEPTAAVGAIDKVALMVVALATVNELTVTPVPLTVTAVAPVKRVPVKTTGTLLVVVAKVAEAGEMEVRLGTRTVKFTVLVAPSGVVMLTVLTPAAAARAIAQLAFSAVAVGVPVMVQVTPVPDTVTADAADRSVPLNVTGTVVPTAPDAGVMEARDGPARVVKPTGPAVPFGVTTLTFWTPRIAVGASDKVALTVVAFTTENDVTVTPVPVTVTAVAPVRLVPVRTTGTLLVVVAKVAEAGAMEVNVGTNTVKVTVLVLPSGVATVSVLAPPVAVAVMVQLAVMLVAVETPVMAQVTPVPDTVIPVARARSVPVRVIGTVVPRAPEVGLTAVSAGPARVVKPSGLLVATGVTTCTFRVPSVAVDAMTRVALMVVELTTTNELTVTPVPVMVTAVAPVRSVPVRTTGTLLAVVALGAEAGRMEVSVGGGSPMPFRVTMIDGLTGSFEAITRFAVRAPPAVGLKVTLMRQEPLNAIDVGVSGQVVVKAKSVGLVPLMLMAPIKTFARPTLLTVMVCAGLVVRSSRAAYVNVLGVTCMTALATVIAAVDQAETRFGRVVATPCPGPESGPMSGVQ
jgi:hypothetical protein